MPKDNDTVTVLDLYEMPPVPIQLQQDSKGSMSTQVEFPIPNKEDTPASPFTSTASKVTTRIITKPTPDGLFPHADYLPESSQLDRSNPPGSFNSRRLGQLLHKRQAIFENSEQNRLSRWGVVHNTTGSTLEHQQRSRSLGTVAKPSVMTDNNWKKNDFREISIGRSLSIGAVGQDMTSAHVMGQSDSSGSPVLHSIQSTPSLRLRKLNGAADEGASSHANPVLNGIVSASTKMRSEESIAKMQATGHDSKLIHQANPSAVTALAELSRRHSPLNSTANRTGIIRWNDGQNSRNRISSGLDRNAVAADLIRSSDQVPLHIDKSQQSSLVTENESVQRIALDNDAVFPPTEATIVPCATSEETHHKVCTESPCRYGELIKKKASPDSSAQHREDSRVFGPSIVKKIFGKRCAGANMLRCHNVFASKDPTQLEHTENNFGDLQSPNTYIVQLGQLVGGHRSSFGAQSNSEPIANRNRVQHGLDDFSCTGGRTVQSCSKVETKKIVGSTTSSLSLSSLESYTLPIRSAKTRQSHHCMLFMFIFTAVSLLLLGIRQDCPFRLISANYVPGTIEKEWIPFSVHTKSFEHLSKLRATAWHAFPRWWRKPADVVLQSPWTNFTHFQMQDEMAWLQAHFRDLSAQIEDKRQWMKSNGGTHSLGRSLTDLAGFLTHEVLPLIQTWSQDLLSFFNLVLQTSYLYGENMKQFMMNSTQLQNSFDVLISTAKSRRWVHIVPTLMETPGMNLSVPRALSHHDSSEQSSFSDALLVSLQHKPGFWTSSWQNCRDAINMASTFFVGKTQAHCGTRDKIVTTLAKMGQNQCSVDHGLDDRLVDAVSSVHAFTVHEYTCNRSLHAKARTKKVTSKLSASFSLSVMTRNISSTERTRRPQMFKQNSGYTCNNTQVDCHRNSTTIIRTTSRRHLPVGAKLATATQKTFWQSKKPSLPFFPKCDGPHVDIGSDECTTLSKTLDSMQESLPELYNFPSRLVSKRNPADSFPFPADTKDVISSDVIEDDAPLMDVFSDILRDFKKKKSKD